MSHSGRRFVANHEAASAFPMPDTPPPDLLATQRNLWFLGTALAIVVAGAIYAFGPGEVSTCLVRSATGVSCPGCGMTRAASALLRGDLRTSWTFHPLAPLVAVEGLIVWAWWGLVAFVRQRRVNEAIVLWLLVANTALLALVWVVRLFGGSLPD